jgi:hypothetical protein
LQPTQHVEVDRAALRPPSRSAEDGRRFLENEIRVD